MRIDVGEPFEPDQANKFVNFVAFLAQHAERHQTGLNVATDGEPREQVRILEDQASLGVRTGDYLIANPKFAGAWEVETGDQAKESRFSAGAWANDGNEFSWRDRKGNGIQGKYASGCAVTRAKDFRYAFYPQRGAFRYHLMNGLGYHFMTPFCHPSTRSRAMNSAVMMVEKNAAMMTRAA